VRSASGRPVTKNTATPSSWARRTSAKVGGRAGELGVAVFFVTGRPEALRTATEENLRVAGYTWDGLVLPPGGTIYTSAAKFKAPARQAIAAQGFSIVLSMGDQQSDLDGGFAERTFKLPNPVYYLP